MTPKKTPAQERRTQQMSPSQRRYESGQSSRSWGLALGAIGVVFGDIGTSPLYAVKESLDPTHGIVPSTEIAGVITPSPYRSPAPKMAKTGAIPVEAIGESLARSAVIPPSPWWSARITTNTYLMETTSMRLQKIRDITPKIFSVLGTIP